jgi:hypothetical protein
VSTAASKSPITHPVAKRFMVVFGAIALIGLFTAPVFQNDSLFILLTIGVVGFMASAFFAADKKIDEPYSLERIMREREPLRTSSASESGCFGEIIGVVFLVALGLGALWALIATVKWMWIHS